MHKIIKQNYIEAYDFVRIRKGGNFMRKIKKVVAAMLLGTAMLTSTVPVLADSGSPEIVPYAQLGTCPGCGYGSASVLSITYGPWAITGAVNHGSHADLVYTRTMTIVTQCPSCGQRITSHQPQTKQVCP